MADINPAAIVDSVVILFTPQVVDSLCLENTTHVIHVSELVAPQFDIPQFICILDGQFTFPSPLNNVQGQWTFDMVDLNAHFGNLVSNTFTPDDLSCYTSVDVSFSIL